MFLRVARWIPANGILFAALVVLATLITADSPGGDASAADIAAYYGDAGDRDRAMLGLVLIGLAGFCFLSFLGSVRGAMARAEGEPARLTSTAVASGTAFIALAVAAHGLSAAPAVAGQAYADFQLDPEAARLFLGASAAFFVLALFAAAAMAAAFTVLAFYTGAFPRWLAIAGALATIAGLVSFFFVPSLVVLAWIVLLSAYLLWPERLGERRPAATMP